METIVPELVWDVGHVQVTAGQVARMVAALAVQGIPLEVVPDAQVSVLLAVELDVLQVVMEIAVTLVQQIVRQHVSPRVRHSVTEQR